MNASFFKHSPEAAHDWHRGSFGMEEEEVEAMEAAATMAALLERVRVRIAGATSEGQSPGRNPATRPSAYLLAARTSLRTRRSARK